MNTADAISYRMQCCKTGCIHLQNWPPIQARAAHICQWELLWPSDLISRTSLGHPRSAHISENLFCVGETVCYRSFIMASILSIVNRYSVLPALSLEGIIHLSIIQGSFNYETFTEFIEGLLATMNPFPGPNLVIVMDNCRIHKSELVLDMIHDVYVLSTAYFFFVG